MDVCDNGYDCADAQPAGSSRLVLYSLFNSARKTLEIFRRLERSSTGRSSSVDFLAEKPGFDDSVHWPSAQCLSLFSKRVQYRVFSSVTMTALISSLQYINAHDALVAKMLGDSVAATASPIPLVMDARTTRGILNSPLWRLTASRCNDAAGGDSGMHVDDGSLAVYSDQTSQLLQWSFIVAGGARIAESESELGDEKVITCAARFIEDMHFICASSSTNEFVRGALWSNTSPFRLAHQTPTSDGRREPCGKCKACFASLPGFGSPTPFTCTPINASKTPSRRRTPAKPTRAAETVALQVDDDVWQDQEGSRPYKKKISSAMDVDYGDEYDEEDDDDDDDEELEEDDDEEHDAEELETIDEEDDEEADDDDASSTSDAHNVVIEVEEDGEYDLTDGEDDDDEDASDDEEKVRAYADDDEDE